MSDVEDIVEFVAHPYTGTKKEAEAVVDYVMPAPPEAPQTPAPTVEPVTEMPAPPDTTKGARRKAEGQRQRRRKGRSSTMLTSTLSEETLGG